MYPFKVVTVTTKTEDSVRSDKKDYKTDATGILWM